MPSILQNNESKEVTPQKRSGILGLIHFLKPYWLLAVAAPAMMLLEVTMDLFQPRLTQFVIDRGIAQHSLPIVLHYGIMMMIAALLGFIGGAGNTVLAVKAAQGFGADIRDTLYRKLQSLSYRNYDELGTGSVITRMTNDVSLVQDAIMTLLRVMVRSPLIMIGSIVMAIITSPNLSSILLVLTPVLLIVVIQFFKKVHPLFMGVQERLDKLNTVTQENVTSIRLIKSFAREDYESERFGLTNKNLADQTTRAMQFVSVMMPGIMMILNIGVVAALWFGGVSVIHGSLHVGQLVAFINYLTRALMSLIMASGMLIQVSRAGASADRISELLETTADVKDPERPASSTPQKGFIQFNQVQFSYNNEENPVLNEITFEAEAGQTVALIGATGSGKSSLIHLIPRFYDVNKGSISIDGIDIKNLKQEDLRRKIGVVFQESILFSGSIRENIRYGKPEATESEIQVAARSAQADEFIRELPQGYDTTLGQQGVNLSGGQKQRLAIARALILHPQILILDDCTSAVDAETEARILSALHTETQDCTVLLISQRISTIKNADKILVLDNGRLVAEGTHQQLLETCSVYQDICKSQ